MTVVKEFFFKCVCVCVKINKYKNNLLLQIKKKLKPRIYFCLHNLSTFDKSFYSLEQVFEFSLQKLIFKEQQI